ncbi:carboxypeptidase-like regulatory domain-containing protein [Neolewinella agarilytica]|uniref:carboxypeptidase-like regulatory domain-containing protein n=1 Tax=Neolewinella agarilytica TaxID=478744 RepID=UPI002354183E|nr:carboxypeptidase-like regulatory domain-containing protein [Neolewinella agarilytica]
MKHLSLFCLFLISLSGYAQTFLTGTIIDATNGQAIPYVNIGLVGKNTGTVSNDNGTFDLRVSARDENAEIRVSILGYQSQSFTVKQLEAKLEENAALRLQAQAYNLDEIVVVPKFTKMKRFGNRAVSTNLNDGFAGDKLGREGGIVVKLKERYRPAVVTNFSTYIVKNTYDEITFRLNFYTVKNGLPDKPLPRESIIISSKIEKGVLSVDLEEYGIVVEDDFAVTLEWIKDFGEYGSLLFAMRLFTGPTCVYRYTSQARWDAYTGIISPSPCMNVTVGYK